MEDRDRAQHLALTIGAVARATGIPSNTLRTWERRYGYPVAERTAGGQRVYSPDVVPHLRLVSEALEKGHRARQVLSVPLEELQALMGATAPEQVVHVPGESVVPGLMEATRRIDGPAIDRILNTCLSRDGLLGFIAHTAVPFLEEVGTAWAEGRLEVFHEHFASERVRQAVAPRVSELASASGPTVVVAALPGEQHDLPMQLASAILAQSGMRVVYLGANTPVPDIVGAVHSTSASRVVVGASGAVHMDGPAMLDALRDALPDKVRIAAGGRALSPVPGVDVLGDLTELAGWVAA